MKYVIDSLSFYKGHINVSSGFSVSFFKMFVKHLFAVIVASHTRYSKVVLLSVVFTSKCVMSSHPDGRDTEACGGEKTTGERK